MPNAGQIASMPNIGRVLIFPPIYHATVITVDEIMDTNEALAHDFSRKRTYTGQEKPCGVDGEGYKKQVHYVLVEPSE